MPAVKLSEASGAEPFLNAMGARRSIYSLDKKLPIPDARVQEIIKEALLHVPSSFNSQTTRVVYLVGEEHEKLWDIAHEVLKAVVPADNFEPTAQKLASFKASYGTILFFDDRSIVEGLQAKFSLYADKFPGWAQESTAMHQYAIWTALALEDVGANLQHYSPLIDTKVQDTWNVPSTWALRAQMVIGNVVKEAAQKTFKPVDGERFFVHGA